MAKGPSEEGLSKQGELRSSIHTRFRDRANEFIILFLVSFL